MADEDILVGDDGGYVIDTEVGRCDVEALPELHNKYFALRHGQSTANLEGVISSNPTVGTVEHGLTELGRVQARAAATSLIEAVGRDQLKSLVFISSDYTRARQTAEQCRAALKNILSFEIQGASENEASLGFDFSKPTVIRQEIRERAFGELDATPQANYSKVWPADLKDGNQKQFGVESVRDVAARIGGFIRSLEEEYNGASIVFVSHADTIQITQCHIAGVDERLFSQVADLFCGRYHPEIRDVCLSRFELYYASDGSGESMVRQALAFGNQLGGLPPYYRGDGLELILVLDVA